MQIFAKAIQQPDSRASAEFRFRHKDGSWRTFEAIGRTYLDSKGDVVGLINSRDITERVQARQILHQRMTELEALYSVSKALRSTLSVEEALPIVLNATLAALHTDSGTVRMYNPDTNMLDSGTKKGWFKDISTAPMKPTIGIAGKVFTTGRTHISEDFAHDPHVVIRGADKIPSGWAGACVPIHVGQAVIGVMFVAVPHPRHISPEQIRLLESMAELTGTAVQRMSLYAQTQAQARRTQQILDSSPEGMLVLDADHCLVQVNPAALAYLPDLAELALGDVVTLLGGQPVTEFLHAIDPQQPWHELTGGEPPRVYEVAAQPLGSTQQPGGWVLLLRDVTADRERQRYQQAQDNLAIVGQMAAGIAHDFNNILGAITLYATLLDNSTGLSKKQHRYVDTIQDQSRHAAELVRQILDFGRRSIMTQTAVDMLSLVRESIKLMGRTLPENIRLNLSFERSEYMVFGDPTRLQQMLINLAFNARDAMPAGGDLTLQLSTITVVSGKQAPLPDMEPGVWIRLDVMDTGSGVAPKHLPHLFQPFFTTKGVGQGTGLGLAQVYGIVKQHEGVIEVESQVGQGTTFSIYLPLHQSAVEDDLPVTPLENAVGGGETILLVEDNDAIRQAVGDTLETLGYRVISAHSGQQALDILAEGADTISLLISDMVMPQVGGLEMAEIVATRHPDLGILIMSGHPLNMGNDVMQQANILGWIQKPFDIDLLAKQIRAILDAPSTM
jgi:signal transduction histidine kinase